jgi:alpha-L-fucosidase
LIHALVGAAGRGANLLLNVGPQPEGTIGAEFSERLLAVGKWLGTYGQTIYGTRRGPVPPQIWGVSTVKSSDPLEVYLHVLKPAETILLPKNADAFVPYTLDKKTQLKLSSGKDGMELSLPEGLRTAPDTIIILSPGILPPAQPRR